MGAAYILFFLALMVDGATDGVNSVTGAVSSGVMDTKRALRFSAFFTFLGCLIFCSLFPYVRDNVARIAEVGEGMGEAWAQAVLTSVAVWSGVALVMGLPTSEGHAISAASAGAAVALSAGVSLEHLCLAALSVPPVVIISFCLSLMLGRVRFFKKRIKKGGKKRIMVLCALSSLLHGAQDGQKFLALFTVATGGRESFGIVFLSGLMMGLGCALFGRRIVGNMGERVFCVSKEGALCAEAGSIISLGLFTLLGVPASTTHVKMTSLWAVGGSGDKSSKRELFGMVLAWILTFPASFALSYLIIKLFWG